MQHRFPDVARWSCYEALLAVVANNFGTFSGTLVIQNRVPQRLAGIFNAIELLIPVLNALGFVVQHVDPLDACRMLIWTSIGRLSQ